VAVEPAGVEGADVAVLVDDAVGDDVVEVRMGVEAARGAVKIGSDQQSFGSDRAALSAGVGCAAIEVVHACVVGGAQRLHDARLAAWAGEDGQQAERLLAAQCDVIANARHGRMRVAANAARSPRVMR
jgi:hypothetical protein